jgi:hypothetical protein
MLYFDWLMAMIFFANFKRICAFFPPRDISDQDHPERLQSKYPAALEIPRSKIRNFDF